MFNYVRIGSGFVQENNGLVQLLSGTEFGGRGNQED
jgi:hypothetical protein